MKTEYIYVKNIEVIKNPSGNDFTTCVKDYTAVKGFKHDDNVYIWNADSLIHYDAYMGLQLVNNNKYTKTLEHYKGVSNLTRHTYYDFIAEKGILLFDCLGEYNFGVYADYLDGILAELASIVKDIETFAYELAEKYSLQIDERNLKLFELYKKNPIQLTNYRKIISYQKNEGG